MGDFLEKLKLFSGRGSKMDCLQKKGAFGLSIEIYSVNLRIQSEYRKTRTRNNSVFRHFSRSEISDEVKIMRRVFNFPNKKIDVASWFPSFPKFKGVQLKNIKYQGFFSHYCNSLKQFEVHLSRSKIFQLYFYDEYDINL